MKLNNALFIYHSKVRDMNTFIKEKIAKELYISVEDEHFGHFKTPGNTIVDESFFEFIWDVETEGTAKISFDNIGGSHICIEAQYSWDAVELYNLISDWINEFDQD